ncbi:hypothetical protein B0H17DRAFT_1326915 [Mycena rosella]|uniref:Uncharacterized protein n=1 Tax=Mycena rosella TaxID=1033263 RepID=A0AAD7E207_MYCRO|nr:hypothetical protein B0H17DRAFT_1326915 [Mycena rosella]
MDPAMHTRLDAVTEDLLGMKLRVAGQVLAYDAYTGLALLRDRDAAVVVDVALCVSAWASEWVGEHLCTVTAVGYLERAPAGIGIPGLPKHFPGRAPRVAGGLVCSSRSNCSVLSHDGFTWSFTAAYNISNARAEPLPAHPPKPNPPLPSRALPTPSYTSSDHPDLGFHHYRAPTPTVFALAALAVFAWPADPAHAFFWAVQGARCDCRDRAGVIDSGAYLIIPVPWTSAAHAQKAQRVTRAAARRATAAASAPITPPAPVPAPSADTPDLPPAQKTRRRTSPAEALTTPQRASARQQKQQQRTAPREHETISPAVVASVPVRPPHVRARSTSQESSETLVASSRAASVASADTVVVDVVAPKSLKCMIAPAEESVDGAPIPSEGGVVTRSRMKQAPEAAKATRKTPYPTTKDKQVAAGRGKGKTPTGKRKAAKSGK